MLASLAGMPLAREHNILDELVRRSAALVIDRFLQTSASRFGRPMRGSHLERYLVDALRRLVATHPAWEPNAERSRVWFGSDGLFIVWPNAATDIRKLLESEQLPGMPEPAETMLEILLGAGVLQVQSSGKPLWSIQPPGAKSALEAVKLIEPAWVLGSLEHRPAPSTAAILAPSQATTPAAPSASSAPSVPDHVPDAIARPTADDTAARVTTKQAAGGAKVGAAISGEQLELEVSALLDPDAHPHPPAAQDAPTGTRQVDRRPQPSAATAAPGPLRLELPMRLAPRLREAVADIAQALGNAEQGCRALATPQGLFIALAEFERRHIEPSHALRGLSEACMLARGPQGPASAMTLEIDGQEHLGLLIAPAYLAGCGPEKAAMLAV